MIKNSRAAAGACAAALAVACQRGVADAPDTYQGIVEHEERVLAFEMPGRVLAVAVERGATVAAGTLVAALDDGTERLVLARTRREAEAAAARAGLVRAGSRAEDVRGMEAQIRAAAAAEGQLTRDLARMQNLAAANAVTAAAFEEASSRLRQATAQREALEERLRALKHGARPDERAGAEAEAAAAAAAVQLEETRLAKHQLHALGPGTVLDRHVEPGEVVGAGSPVVTVADTRRPYVEVFVPQAALAGIRVGGPASVRTDSSSQPLPGRVELISPRTEFTPRFLFSERERPNLVIRVRVRVADPQQRLHAGVPAFVEIAKTGP
jgi:HlyD family secretion protein